MPQNHVKDPKLIDTWTTAAHYHLVHSLLLTVTPLLSGASHTYSTRLLSAGIVLFSGSLYTLALTGEKRLGAVAPVGGAALIAGWSVPANSADARMMCIEQVWSTRCLLPDSVLSSVDCWNQGCFGASQMKYC